MSRLGSRQAAIYDHQGAGGPGRRFKDIREVRAYVDALVDSDDFQATWPDVLVIECERRGSGATWSLACPSLSTIRLAELSQLIVLHEVAHICAPNDGGHGPEFARTFLTLVRREMGFHAYGAILNALRRSDAFRGDDLTTLDTWV